MKNINNKDKEILNEEKRLDIKSDIIGKNLSEFDESKKRNTNPKGKVEELSKNSRTKKKKKSKKNRTMILKNTIPVEINPSSVINNQKDEKNIEEKELNTDTFDKQNISNLKLKSPTTRIIPKIFDSKNLISLNSETDKIKEIEIKNENKENKETQKEGKNRVKLIKISLKVF